MYNSYTVHVQYTVQYVIVKGVECDMETTA